MNLTEMTDAELNERAAKAMGWRWMAYICIPVRGTPGYPKECLVRSFIQPEKLQTKRWKEYREHHNHPEPVEAIGTEPFAYESMSGTGPPDYLSDLYASLSLQSEIEKRGLEGEFGDAMSDILGGSKWAFLNATPRQRTIAFLLATEGK